MLTIQSGLSNTTKNTAFGNYRRDVHAHAMANTLDRYVYPEDKIMLSQHAIDIDDEPEYADYEEIQDTDNIEDDIDDAEIAKRHLKEEEDNYNEEKNFWSEQKETFEDLANDAEVPGLIKKPMKWISIGISSILGGMAMVWGSKKSMGAIETLAKTKKVKAFNTSVSKKINEFNNSSIGKSKIVSGIRKQYNKLTSKLDKEKVKNATANTLGVSGGVTSGITAAKDAKREEEKDAK